MSSLSLRREYLCLWFGARYSTDTAEHVVPGSIPKPASRLVRRFSWHAGHIVPGDGLQPAQDVTTCQCAGNKQNWDEGNQR